MRDLLAAMQYATWVLPALLLLPLAGAALIGLTCRPAPHPDSEEEYVDGGRVRAIAFGTLLLEAFVSAGMWWAFDPAQPGWQFRQDLPWIPDWGARLTLGVDGISLFMILLTTFLMPLALMGDWTSVRTKLRTHYVLLLVLTTGMLGVFIALDLSCSTCCGKLMLVPMYFIIGIWGGENRALREPQVLHLYDVRLAADAASPSLSRLSGWHRRDVQTSATSTSCSNFSAVRTSASATGCSAPSSSRSR